MALEDYEKSKSNEIISEKRIKSLERITDVELFPVIEKMRIDRLAGYQEKIEYESCCQNWFDRDISCKNTIVILQYFQVYLY